jgi:mRNA interferase YafQ
MLQKHATSSFKKDKNLLERQNADLARLEKIMSLIASESPLPASCRDHALHGTYSNCRECHIKGDWVLIYRIDDEQKKVLFFRTGSHAELF